MRYLSGRDYFHVPIHEYELTHHGGGNRTAQLLQNGGRDAFDRMRAMPLLWGEDFLLKSRSQWACERGNPYHFLHSCLGPFTGTRQVRPNGSYTGVRLRV